MRRPRQRTVADIESAIRAKLLTIDPAPFFTREDVQGREVKCSLLGQLNAYNAVLDLIRERRSELR